MHCRPGIVSHSDADAPTSWKNCCAIFTCSLEPNAWPTEALTTPFRMYSCGVLGSTSLMSSWASCMPSWRRW